MNFDNLTEFIEGDEEMGVMELYGNEGRINIRTYEDQKVLDIHFYARYDNEYSIIEDVLNSNGVKYYKTIDDELNSEKITVDANCICIFSQYDYRVEESDFIPTNKGEFIEMVDAWAHVQINRVRGIKNLEITFFIGFPECKLLNSFLNCYAVHFSEFYHEFMGDQIKVDIDVRCHFLPMRAGIG
jgi:hypothetical protein